MKNRSRYAAEWNDTIRPQVLRRDKYTCQHCGAKHRSTGYYEKTGRFINCDSVDLAYAKRQGYKIITVYLQVCHKDQNPANNSPINLVSLCPPCHLRMDAKFNRIKRLARTEPQPPPSIGLSYLPELKNSPPTPM